MWKRISSLRMNENSAKIEKKIFLSNATQKEEKKSLTDSLTPKTTWKPERKISQT